MSPPPALLSSINQRAKEIVDACLIDARFGIEQQETDSSATVLDFAKNRTGTMAAGIALARICMADLAEVSITPSDYSDLTGLPLPRVNVATDFPLLACMASQYAGWPLSEGEYFAMCSGPARSLRGKEEMLEELNLVHTANVAVGILESSTLPTAEVIQTFAASCKVKVENVTLCVAPTASLPGTIQVVARSVETAMHKLHELKFDLTTVRSGFGSAPLPPIAGDDLTSLGWTNDAVLYGGCVNLVVETDDAAIEAVLEQIPSCSSSDFGKPFLEIFHAYEKDFYKIDKLLFSPAQVVINNMTTGRTFIAGAIRNDLLRKSFGMDVPNA